MKRKELTFKLEDVERIRSFLNDLCSHSTGATLEKDMLWMHTRAYPASPEVMYGGYYSKLRLAQEILMIDPQKPNRLLSYQHDWPDHFSKPLAIDLIKERFCEPAIPI
jgi:hypothetical protein